MPFIAICNRIPKSNDTNLISWNCSSLFIHLQRDFLQICHIIYDQISIFIIQIGNQISIFIIPLLLYCNRTSAVGDGVIGLVGRAVAGFRVSCCILILVCNRTVCSIFPYIIIIWLIAIIFQRQFRPSITPVVILVQRYSLVSQLCCVFIQPIQAECCTTRQSSRRLIQIYRYCICIVQIFAIAPSFLNRYRSIGWLCALVSNDNFTSILV